MFELIGDSEVKVLYIYIYYVMCLIAYVDIVQILVTVTLSAFVC